ncbi:MAG: hypothetical protein Q8R74_10025 [Methylophilus sp.]|nr:hypothetical protein [Methylophilus sp.]
MLKHIFASSTLLTDSQYELMCTTGRIIEQDARGPKVIILENGNFLKIFRVRHRFSGARIYSHARRFNRNAFRLEALNIPTVKVISIHHLEASGHSLVIYQPLAGKSIRELIHTDLENIAKTDTILGHFLAKLHDNGVHFHSLHTGNILFLPNGQFGLIDISDMTIYPWPLFCNTRLRSIKRLYKYAQDFELLGRYFWMNMLDAYFKKSNINASCKEKILSLKQT